MEEVAQPDPYPNLSAVRARLRDAYTKVYGWVAASPIGLFVRIALILALALVIISSVAVCTYGAFYWLYLPEQIHVRQLYFQRTELTKERLDSSGKTRTTTSQILQVEVSLLHEGSPFFRAGQSYNIELELDMPESEVNYNAGTFMLSALYYDEVGMQTAVLVCGSGLMQLLIPTLYPYLSILSGRVLTSSSRLVMLRYRSYLLRVMDTLVYAPFYLLGLSEQTQVRKIQLFKNYRENGHRPTNLITIDIDNPYLQIYGAKIVIEAQFGGLRYYMHYWPITTAVIATSIIWGGIIACLMGSSWFAFSRNFISLRNEAPQGRHAELQQSTGSSNTRGLGQSAPTAVSPSAMAPGAPDASLRATERAPAHTDNRTEVSNLGVTSVDSSDMAERQPIVRRRNHQAEPAST